MKNSKKKVSFKEPENERYNLSGTIIKHCLLLKNLKTSF